LPYYLLSHVLAIGVGLKAFSIFTSTWENDPI